MNWKTLTLLLLFIFTRIFIWQNPPPDFSEIIYSYMPYAHLWDSGTRPYLDQWYEYPPATIPLFYIPHLIDKTSHGSFFSINYGQAYRGQLLLIDTLIFFLIWKTLSTLKVNAKNKFLSLLFYIGLTAKANHFIYDSMDLVFASALMISISGPIIFKNEIAQGLSKWIGYWLAVALKYINGPMGLIGVALNRKDWKKEIVICGISLLLIWGIPLALYRSSLQVSLVYHQIRGVQIDSVPAVIIRMIDTFTHSEKVIEIYKNYEISGPITSQVSKITSPLFIVGLIGFIGMLSIQALRIDEKKKSMFWLSATVGYIFLFLLIGKVLSRPFLLWTIPLLAVLPFESIKKQLHFLIPGAVMVLLTFSPVPNTVIGPFAIPLWVGIIRSICLVWIFLAWIIWHQSFFFLKKSEKKSKR